MMSLRSAGIALSDDPSPLRGMLTGKSSWSCLFAVLRLIVVSSEKIFANEEKECLRGEAVTKDPYLPLGSLG